jgi:DnaK suppressor protein
MTGLLRLVDSALREIHDGTFGICNRCGESISVKRLKAVPWSPYCVSCQQTLELQKQREDTREGEGYRLAS